MEPTRHAVLLGLAAFATVGAAAEAAPPAKPPKPPPLKIRGRSSSLVLRDRMGGGGIRMGIDHASGPDTSVLTVWESTEAGDHVILPYDETYKEDGRALLAQTTIQGLPSAGKTTSALVPSRRAAPTRSRYTWPSPKRFRRR